MLPKLVIIAAVIAFAASSALMVGSAEARRGKGPGSNGQTSAAVLTLTPNPVAANSDYVISGTGFAPNVKLTIGILHSEQSWSTQYYNIVSDDTGAFSLTRNSYLPGEIVHDAYQQKGNSSNFEVVTSATLVVNP